jgi:lipopolysaccharide/colanic/teichoic acid biosynthesis glycosyltransferase
MLPELTDNELRQMTVLKPTTPVRPPLLAKRLFDMFLSGFGLVVSSPLWLIIAAAIKLDDGGPVFHRQIRIGRGGQPFGVLKFRSMRVSGAIEDTMTQAREHDPRITRVGAILRATGADELPQLVNIFCGEMSFVGPRALMPEEVDAGSNGRVVPIHEIPGYDVRTTVTPGLTGLAQIYAPRDVPRSRKFRYDKLYVARQGFWLDIRLILVSFWISARGTWEARGPKY